MRQRDYRGDVLTLQVHMDRPHSATINGRRVEGGPGHDLRNAVVAQAAAFAARVGRALPMIVQEPGADCALLVGPDGDIAVLGRRGRHHVERWLPTSHVPASKGATAPNPAALTKARRRRLPAGRLQLAGNMDDNVASTSRTSTLPRYGKRPSAQAPTVETVPPVTITDDAMRMAAQRLGLTPDALAAALRTAGEDDVTHSPDPSDQDGHTHTAR
jgi:hypothetical protein